ncbi:T9SS type A sorting domain-containing protein [Winogradskyella vincentii]|uniref:T9SS type A sorting domain-containing protein n=1 Tax=Winogradskyella vincentii TaxID=2877122 RepID=A0ABS7Y1G5_9FLAO|nr:T9SS type A sorting domain-containing protein [Winogradskyella vincentii]MCA0153090.1 T9SS type A sorting domain-containing protein [Winogradskyella vincentii]
MITLKSVRYSITKFISFLNKSFVQNSYYILSLALFLNLHAYALDGSNSAHIGLVKLQIDNDENNFRTDIYFNANASLGLDPGYDSSLFGGVAPDFSVYSLLVEDNTGIPMGIQALGEYDMNGTIVPIGIHTVQGELISVQITENTISPSINIYLEDTELGTLTLLNSNNYQFLAQENITGTGRFYLRFGADVLSINDSPLDSLKIHSNFELDQIIVSGQLNSPTIFALYDIQGKKVISNKFDPLSSSNTIQVSNLSSGIYIIELTDNNGYRRSKKLLIK